MAAGNGTLGPMDTEPPRRVKVVLADGARRPRPDAAAREVEEQTPVGEVLVTGLIRTQLALAVRLSLVVAALFGIQPVLFALAPGLAHVSVGGLPLPWLLLGVLAYPAVIVIGWVYVRAAQRNERRFAELVSRE
jgi:uncharacterized membrane protein (DUF485 family)